jgi:hypothetical protein
MNFPGFVGQSFPAASPVASVERTMNLFPEAIPAAPGGAGRLVLYRTFAVAGNTFYELLTPTTYVARGTLSEGDSPVSMISNSAQIVVLADGEGWLFTLVTNTFGRIVAPAFPDNATSLTSLDTYFVTLRGGTNQFFISSPLDGAAWSGLDFGSSEEPDNAVAVASSHLYLWIFGQTSTVIFQDTGNTSQTFQRVPGSQIEQGCGAANSVVVLDNTLFWLGDDSRGPAIVYRADGFLPTRISTHALEYAIQQYARIDDAIAYSYQESGHLFYVLHFPTAKDGRGATWAYDVATAMWHERGWWDTSNGYYTAHRARYHAFNFNQHLVGDYTNGNIYQLALTCADDDGNPLRWLRRAPHLNDEQNWIFYSSFQLDMQVGGGLDGGIQGSSPGVVLRYSNDGGFTWSNDLWASSGKIGEYATRVIWRRLGRSRNRVFEVSGSDPVAELCLTGAYLDAGRGDS